MQKRKPRWKKQKERVEKIAERLGFDLLPRPKSKRKQIMAAYHKKQKLNESTP